MFITRLATDRIHELLRFFPVLAVTGPRQSGKSTLLQTALPEYRYVTFDSPETRLQWQNDPVGLMRQLPGPVIFDEVQKFPGLFEYIKLAVDADRSSGRFVLTGSAQFGLIKSISESLAGRCGFQGLLPFERSEVPALDLGKLELFGWYPELATRNWQLSREWYEAYLATYLERDVRTLLNIGNLSDFHRVLGLLALRTGQELNASSLAREAGVTEKTVMAWISVLEASYILFLLKPWHRNLGKRLIKRPKVYFWDTGLACHLAGLRSVEALQAGPMAGALFENLLMADMAKQIMHRGLDCKLYYLRASGGLEVDFILEDMQKRLLTIGEIKRRQTIRPDDTRHIRALLGMADLLPAPGWESRGLILHNGSGCESLDINIESHGLSDSFFRL